MFEWFNYLGLSKILALLRELAGSIQVPAWILYYVPNGMWTYSFTIVLACIWINTNNWQKYLWIFFPMTAGIIFEIGQLLNLLPGTFSHGDIIAHLLASLIAITIVCFKAGRFNNFTCL